MGSDNISISGSQFGDGVAIGRKARGGNVMNTSLPDGLADVSRRLDELSQQIDRHQASLADAAELKDLVKQIRQELNDPEPRKGRISTMLTRIGAGAGGMSAVAGAVTKVTEALAAIGL